MGGLFAFTNLLLAAFENYLEEKHLNIGLFMADLAILFFYLPAFLTSFFQHNWLKKINVLCLFFFILLVYFTCYFFLDLHNEPDVHTTFGFTIVMCFFGFVLHAIGAILDILAARWITYRFHKKHRVAAQKYFEGRNQTPIQVD